MNPSGFVPPERGLQPEGLLPSRGVAASGFRPLRKIPHCCLPQEAGPCLRPGVADRPLRPATDRRLGGPLPRQQANPPRAPPRPEAEATFSHQSENRRGYPVLIRVSPGYPDVEGRLPTCYSPVRRCPHPEGWFSLDLHVLSAPPAFVLSQDQTLREELVAPASRCDLHFELVLKVSPRRA